VIINSIFYLPPLGADAEKLAWRLTTVFSGQVMKIQCPPYPSVWNEPLKKFPDGSCFLEFLYPYPSQFPESTFLFFRFDLFEVSLVLFESVIYNLSDYPAKNRIQVLKIALRQVLKIASIYLICLFFKHLQLLFLTSVSLFFRFFNCYFWHTSIESTREYYHLSQFSFRRRSSLAHIFSTARIMQKY
jgi:hypothetical protein